LLQSREKASKKEVFHSFERERTSGGKRGKKKRKIWDTNAIDIQEKRRDERKGSFSFLVIFFAK
jgi:hypothetical protein